MPRKKSAPASGLVELVFPFNGINVSVGKADQAPGTTFSCQNVRGMDPQTQRARGSQRHGLLKYSDTQISANDPQLLDLVVADAAQLPSTGGSAGTGFGSGSSFVPITGGFSLYNNLGQLLYSTQPGYGMPSHASQDDEGKTNIDVPNGNGIDVKQFPNIGGENLPIIGGDNHPALEAPWNVNFDFGAPPVARVALGTATVSGHTMTIPAVTVKVGERLVVCVSGDINGDTVKHNGNSLTRDQFTTLGTIIEVWSYSPLTDQTGDIVFLDTVGPFQYAMTAMKILNLPLNAVDTSQFNVAGAPSTTPDSLATGTTAQANEFWLGCVVTNGPIGDAAGTWSNGFTNGQRDGTTGHGGNDFTISDGYKIVSATGTARAAKTGEVSHNWLAIVVAYK